MLSKNQKKRLILVSFLPLIILSLWFADSGYKQFVPSHYNASCKKTGDCISFASLEPLPFASVLSEIYLGAPGGGGAVLEGGLNERIVLAGSNVVKTLIMPRHPRDGIYSCGLDYRKRLNHMTFADGQLKVDSFVDDIFQLDCGHFSQDKFRFADRAVHDTLISALEKNDELRSKFYEYQTRISIVAFFVPFVVFFGTWALISVLMALFRFVKYGRNPV